MYTELLVEVVLEKYMVAEKQIQEKCNLILFGKYDLEGILRDSGRNLEPPQIVTVMTDEL